MRISMLATSAALTPFLQHQVSLPVAYILPKYGENPRETYRRIRIQGRGADKYGVEEEDVYKQSHWHRREFLPTDRRAQDQTDAMDMARYMACHQQWIAGQEAGLGELVEAAANAAAGRATDAELRAVVERCMRGYEEYATSRRAMAREDGAAFFAPPWCTAFENAVLWLGGCRPSLTIRLLYSLSGEGLEAHIEEFLSGRGESGVTGGQGMGLLGITATQLDQINDLHRRTLRDEGFLTERLASLQEDIADRPLLPIVREREREGAAVAASLAGAGGQGSSANCDGVAGVVDAELEAAMESYRAGLARLLEEADELRLSTARALATEILTPRQAVETLVAAKQLHLSVRDWSRRKEGVQNGRLPRAATASTSSSHRPNP